MAEYTNPKRAELKAVLEKYGFFSTPEHRAMANRAIERLDDTNPLEVIDRLPQAVRIYYIQALCRAKDLLPMMARALELRAWVEAIVICHNLAKVCLRILYVLGWQRGVDRPLTDEELSDFRTGYSRRADVYDLVGLLRKGRLLEHVQARGLWELNEWRNQAVHGLMFGEIAYEDLELKAKRAFQAASGALNTAQWWLDNPKPLRRLLRDDVRG